MGKKNAGKHCKRRFLFFGQNNRSIQRRNLETIISVFKKLASKVSTDEIKEKWFYNNCETTFFISKLSQSIGICGN